jgi:uncharacterized membrane protein
MSTCTNSCASNGLASGADRKVNLNATIETETNSPQDAATGTPEGDPLRWCGSLEGWLHDHLQAVALAVTAAGFVARILVATRSYLNPDEAMQYQLFNQDSVLLAYKANLPNPHPPLFAIVVYFWHLLGSSELMLRLPSVFLGTALCWVAFKWIGTLFGRAAGLVGLVIVAFCPALIALSAEMRQYALLLFCVVAALYFLERAFQEKSIRKMLYFSVFLYLAILSHYSAFFFALAAGLYVLARILDSQLPPKAIAAWAGGQVGAIAIYLFLYLTQVSRIRTKVAGWAGDLDKFYFHSDRESVFSFTVSNTLDIFRYMFVQSYVSRAMLLLLIVGVAFFFGRDLVSRHGNPNSDRVGILLLLPFVAVWGATIAGIYPYASNRYTIFLAPFAIATASFLLAAVSGQKLWTGLLIATLLMGVSNASGNPLEPGFTKENQSRKLMLDVIGYMKQSIPRGDLILVDYQSSQPLAYYLCGPRQISIDRSSSDFDQFNCNGYSVVSVHFWKLKAESLAAPFEKVVHARGLKPGDRVWVFQTGWGGNLILAELPEHFPQFRCFAPRTFGEDISVIPFVVGPDLSPAAPPFAACRN